MHNKTLYSTVRGITCLWLYLLLAAIPAQSMPPQEGPNNIRLPKMLFEKEGEYDTLAFELGQDLARETAGLMEREIDPAAYILGPNDVLTVSIVSSKSSEYVAKVSPEGKVLIPTVGTVDVKNKTLAEADTLIRKAVRKVYSTAGFGMVLSKLRTFKVAVIGQVRKPATVEATAVDRVSEVLERAGGLLYNASMRRIEVIREGEPQQVRADLQAFYNYGDRSMNPTVMGGDQIRVPVMYEKLVSEIRGAVPYPDKYEFLDGDKLSTLVRFAGGFAPSAFLDSVEISRFASFTGEIERRVIDVSAWKGREFGNGELPGDFPLQAGDRVNVRFTPDWLVSNVVKVEGEVRFPGRYPIPKGSLRLRELLERAGGLTRDASAEGAVFFRNADAKVVDKEFTRLANIPPSEMSEDELKYFVARAREIRGLMAVDFTKLEENDGNNNNNILVQGQDSIYVPPKKDYVNILGRVNSPGRVVYREGLTYLDYINLAGGFGYRADEEGTLVIKSKGEQFLAQDRNYILEPGDNLLVPEESDTKFIDVFTDALTIATQLVTIAGVVISIVNISR